MTKPNVLLITTDQQRFDTISALGNKHIYTPHLDWLVDQGIAFNRAYTTSPICMPARATIMTGREGYSTGLTCNNHDNVPMRRYPTLPGLLTEAGYQTRAQGKMHFHPVRTNYGFEHMELPLDYYRELERRGDQNLPKQHGLGENEITPAISTVDESHSLTHWTVRRSIDFLEARDETRPFFLWSSFTKPHPPFDPCPNYWALYQNRDVPAPITGDWSASVEETPQAYLRPTYALNNAYRMSSDQLKDSKRAYYGCITQIDYQLGLLFARMQEMNLFENTWIIFTSDHGDMLGDHHMGAKVNFLEGSAHIPFLIKPPSNTVLKDFEPGTRVDSLVTLADVLPTVLAAAGVESPEGIDGVDLMRQSTLSEDRPFYGVCESFHCIIDGNYKYHWSALGGEELLFNLKDDPMEQTNLCGLDDAQDTLNELRRTLKTRMADHDSPYLSNDEFKLEPAISGPKDVDKWPGFHSTKVDSDVLH